jgi:hypothetical protein
LIDDDNFATHHDLIGHHSIVGDEIELNHISSDSGWFNVCESMVEENNIPFYPRGYPWSERFKTVDTVSQIKTSKVVVNLGLVLGDPDIDAVSRLFWPINVIALDSRYEPNFALNPGTWAPFNDQNTSISREIIPIFFKPPSTGRNADIWTAYVVTKLAEHFNHVITYGQPLVKQIRNIHDLREDYKIEELHNRSTDRFVNLLKSIDLKGDNYLEALIYLIDKSLEEMGNVVISDELVDNVGRHHQLIAQTQRYPSLLKIYQLNI